MTELEHYRKKLADARTYIDTVEAKNMELLETLAFMQKDGYTYDQVNRKMIVCEACGKHIMENEHDS